VQEKCAKAILFMVIHHLVYQSEIEDHFTKEQQQEVLSRI
jgi:hypothetical protein